MLFENGIQVGPPLRAEAEFWAELEKLRKQNSTLQSTLNSVEKGIKQVLEDYLLA